ncbi:MAG: ThuA domain-containing protein [Acidobacteriota bacterium]
MGRIIGIVIAALAALPCAAQSFRAVAIAERGGLHKPFVDAAKAWLAREGEAGGFTVDYIEDTAKIDDAFLAQYRLFIQLNYPPYMWTPTAMDAFRKYIEQGRGGWIGFHHASLLGEFDGYPMWPWFWEFMGSIRFKAYIPDFATGTVKVEAPTHPIMRGIAASFPIENEEWYTYDRSPRPNVRVLAGVDESTYTPDSKTKMGDHPVVWTNERVRARNVYIFMGHHPELFRNEAFTTLFHNSIAWAAEPQPPLRALAFYSSETERDHVEFAEQAIGFYKAAAKQHNYTFEATNRWDDMNPQRLEGVDVVLWLNEAPHGKAVRAAFERYMEKGGGWIGFHGAGYNDQGTGWPWFVRFFGGAVFYGNNWPPLEAKLRVDDPRDPLTKDLPPSFISPDNEWYSWLPNPRDNKDVKVLLTLDPSNYPLGLKDTITGGDVPVMWSNTKYKMLYINMGHGDKIFTCGAQNKLFIDALVSMGRRR